AEQRGTAIMWKHPEQARQLEHWTAQKSELGEVVDLRVRHNNSFIPVAVLPGIDLPAQGRAQRVARSARQQDLSECPQGAEQECRRPAATTGQHPNTPTAVLQLNDTFGRRAVETPVDGEESGITLGRDVKALPTLRLEIALLQTVRIAHED